MDHLPHMQDKVCEINLREAQARAVQDLSRIESVARLTPFISGRGDRTLGEHEGVQPPRDWSPNA